MYRLMSIQKFSGSFTAIKKISTSAKIWTVDLWFRSQALNIFTTRASEELNNAETQFQFSVHNKTTKRLAQRTVNVFMK